MYVEKYDAIAEKFNCSLKSRVVDGLFAVRSEYSHNFRRAVHKQNVRI